MRIKHRFATVMQKDMKKSKEIRNILEKYSIKYEYEEENNVLGFHWSLIFFLYDDMVSFDKIYNTIKPYEFVELLSNEFDKNEMNNAEWYEIVAPSCQYPQPDDDWSYYKFTFDTKKWCPYCNVGKIQNNPYRLLKKPKQKSTQFWGLFWEAEALFCGEAIKNIFERENIQGIHFIQPVNKRGIPFEGYYQIIMETVLDKGFIPINRKAILCDEKTYHKEDYQTIIETVFKDFIPTNREMVLCDEKTHHCGKVKYEPAVGGNNFDKNIFSAKVDFCLSNEWFGSGWQADRLIIISKKVYEIIKKNKFKGLIIEPIFHNERGENAST